MNDRPLIGPERLFWGPISELGAADRLRRLGLLHESVTFDRVDPDALRRARDQLHRGLVGILDDDQLHQLDAVLDGEQASIPAECTAPVAEYFGVSSDYFADDTAADRDEAQLLPRLLAQAGADRARVCRTPPSRPLRTAICVRLLEIARSRRRPDETV